MPAYEGRRRFSSFLTVVFFYGKCRITVAYEVADKEKEGHQVEWQVLSLVSVKEHDE